MGVQYHCGSENRRAAVSKMEGLNGIDYLEVSPSGSLLLVLLKKQPAVTLTPAMVAIAGVSEARRVRVTEIVPEKSPAGHAYRLTLDAAGDLSVYTLRLCSGDASGSPQGIDPRLAEVPFTFRSAAPADLNSTQPASLLVVEPELSYLAKDYASFRRLMLDRMAMLLPGGVDEQPADLQVALVELLAYAADRLSYYQDAVATEAYLSTARRRVSLRRHARLLDYRVHEGCNARVWICCNVEREVPVSEDWRFFTQGAEPLFFEPCHYPVLYPQHSRITLYAWGEDTLTLPLGATRATLAQQRAGQPQIVVGRNGLAPGALLMLEFPGGPGVAALHHVVRLVSVDKIWDPIGDQEVIEVAWNAEDGLPSALPVCRDGQPVASACANVVLADHGMTTDDKQLGEVPERGPFYPRLRAGPLTHAEALPSDLAAPERAVALTSAAGLMRRRIRAALPAIKRLHGDGEDWQVCGDLLAVGAAAAFVVESEHDGSAYLRFGDGVYGRQPALGSSFSACYRVGNGRSGNVAAESICRIAGTSVTGVTVRNLLPATGGEDSEPAEQVRLFAPQAFRTQERAVAAEDYAALTQEFPGVQRAAAAVRWIGSWYTVYLFVDRVAGRAVDDEFKRRLREHLDRYRLAGYDLEIRGPTFVPLKIELSVEILPGFAQGAVMSALDEALGSGELGGGRRGFFHPDSWTFGQPVYLSRLYQAALAMPGVAAIDATHFYRLGRPESTSRDRGAIVIGPHEIARLDADAGKLTIPKVTYGS